jgi:hypothetical protein
MEYRKIVPVSVSGDSGEGPSYAVVELDDKQIKRILQLARAIKRLKVQYILEYESVELVDSDEDMEDPGVVTDETPEEELPLLINDDSPVTQVLVKHRLAGHSVHSAETMEELRSYLHEWAGCADCMMLEVSDDDFHYRGYIKHTDISWETRGIPLTALPHS